MISLDLNEYLCECCNLATHYCEEHDAYLCEDEVPDHPCKLKSLITKSDEQAPSESSSFDIQTQSLQSQSNNLPEFFKNVKTSFKTSLDTLEKVLLNIQNSINMRLSNSSLKKNQVNIRDEWKTVQTFVGLLGFMTAELAEYMNMNEQLILASQSNTSSTSTFLNRLLEKAGKSISSSTNMSLENKTLANESNYVRLDYSHTGDAFSGDNPSKIDDFSMEERVIEITEFLNPMFKKNNSVRPSDENSYLMNMDSDLTFEVEDYDLITTENVKDKFDESHGRLCRILDQALHDINCPDFYNKDFVESVNSYFDQFRAVLETMLKELKNNFNKL